MSTTVALKNSKSPFGSALPNDETRQLIVAMRSAWVTLLRASRFRDTHPEAMHRLAQAVGAMQPCRAVLTIAGDKSIDTDEALKQLHRLYSTPGVRANLFGQVTCIMAAFADHALSIEAEAKTIQKRRAKRGDDKDAIAAEQKQLRISTDVLTEQILLLLDTEFLKGAPNSLRAVGSIEVVEVRTKEILSQLLGEVMNLSDGDCTPDIFERMAQTQILKLVFARTQADPTKLHGMLCELLQALGAAIRVYQREIKNFPQKKSEAYADRVRIEALLRGRLLQILNCGIFDILPS